MLLSIWWGNPTKVPACKIVFIAGLFYFIASGLYDENVVINCNAQKVVNYALVAQDEKGISKVIGVYSAGNKTVIKWDPGTITFPPDVPECGYDLSKCPSKYFLTQNAPTGVSLIGFSLW